MRSVMLFQMLRLAQPLSTWSSTTASRPVTSRFLELVQDAANIARETGPKATIQRTLEGQRAALATVVELSGELPTPPSPLEVVGWVQDSRGESRLHLEKFQSWATTNVKPEVAPKFLRKFFERLGATYVKLGQFIASSPTLFPDAYVREFEKCLDDAPVIPFSEIQKILEKEGFVFDSIDEVPLASASIAQVHGAVYKGEDVVIKVRKPGVDLLLKADLGFLDIAGKCLEFIAPDLGRLSLANALEDLRAVMLDELDFEKEAKNLKEYSKWLQDSNLNTIATCPLPFDEVSSKNVLTMTRLRGASITDLAAPSNIIAEYNGVTPEQFIVNALDVWAASVITAPFFHADVHAANLLALPDGRIGFIDFGIVGRIPPAIFDSVGDAATAAALRDYDGLATALRNLGASDKDVDLQAFASDLKHVFLALDSLDPDVVVTAEGQQAVARIAVDDRQVSDIVLSLVNCAETYGIKLPREFGLLVKQALYFDKFTKLLAPDLDMAQTIQATRSDLDSLPDATVRPPRRRSLPPPKSSSTL